MRLKLAKVLAGGFVRFFVRIRNEGDGAAPATRIRVFLVRARGGRAGAAVRRRSTRLRTLPVRRLRAGSSRRIRVRARIPRGMAPGRYRLIVATAKPGGRREYSRTNNRLSTSVRVAKP